MFAHAFNDVLAPVVGRAIDVTVSHSYDVLARNVLSAAVDLAWAPRSSARERSPTVHACSLRPSVAVTPRMLLHSSPSTMCSGHALRKQLTTTRPVQKRPV